MLHGVIFDLGSTLIQSQFDHQWGVILPRMRADVLQHLNAHGYTLDPQAFLNRLAANYAAFDEQRQTDWVEYTTGYLLTTTLADLGVSAPTPELLHDAVKAYYAYSESLYTPTPGAHDVLRQLQASGLRLAIISNAGDNENVQRLIDRVKLRDYFDPIIVSASARVRKPNPRIFELVLNAWGFPAQECVMVGDTLGADILGAQLAGLRHVWLTTTAASPVNRAHRDNIVPEATIDRLAELPGLLQHWGAPVATFS
ncbi:MAG: HAD family hydrolase [Anaerolineales bacterium]